MQYPTININGTDGDTLIEEHFAAIEALEQALIVMRRITVHGRDYPPTRASSSGAGDAYREHHKRLADVTLAKEQLKMIHNYLVEQQAERKARKGAA